MLFALKNIYTSDCSTAKLDAHFYIWPIAKQNLYLKFEACIAVKMYNRFLCRNSV